MHGRTEWVTRLLVRCARDTCAAAAASSAKAGPRGLFPIGCGSAATGSAAAAGVRVGEGRAEPEREPLPRPPEPSGRAEREREPKLEMELQPQPKPGLELGTVLLPSGVPPQPLVIQTSPRPWPSWQTTGCENKESMNKRANSK